LREHAERGSLSNPQWTLELRRGRTGHFPVNSSGGLGKIAENHLAEWAGGYPDFAGGRDGGSQVHRGPAEVGRRETAAHRSTWSDVGNHTASTWRDGLRRPGGYAWWTTGPAEPAVIISAAGNPLPHPGGRNVTATLNSCAFGLLDHDFSEPRL
jgi:hypothetical protein